MSPQPLGQNFLADPVWRERIVRGALGLPAFMEAAPKPTGVWIEIGAGHGEMTVLLAPHVSRLIVIELDDKLLPRLTRTNRATLKCHRSLRRRPYPQSPGTSRRRAFPRLRQSPLLHYFADHPPTFRLSRPTRRRLHRGAVGSCRTPGRNSRTPRLRLSLHLYSVLFAAENPGAHSTRRIPPASQSFFRARGSAITRRTHATRHRRRTRFHEFSKRMFRSKTKNPAE